MPVFCPLFWQKPCFELPHLLHLPSEQAWWGLNSRAEQHLRASVLLAPAFLVPIILGLGVCWLYAYDLPESLLWSVQVNVWEVLRLFLPKTDPSEGIDAGRVQIRDTQLAAPMGRWNTWRRRGQGCVTMTLGHKYFRIIHLVESCLEKTCNTDLQRK